MARACLVSGGVQAELGQHVGSTCQQRMTRARGRELRQPLGRRRAYRFMTIHIYPLETGTANIKVSMYKF